ncbi:type II CAAX endopeptidase family protein [Flavobacterium sp.]|uniref:CPBP family intramembrane glutamic endopeptidase n=1 Tax=Flavobacterium sp. TaxID=239 RepID=UPI002602BE14|nr:type II CAAX endopeptidase family protein [Flavobacterium sp.]
MEIKTRHTLFGMFGIVFLLILISLLGTTPVLQWLGFDKMGPPVLWLSRGLIWGALALLWWYAVKIERQPLLFWKERRLSFLGYVGSIAGVLFILLVLIIMLGLVAKLSGVNTRSEKMLMLMKMLGNHQFLLVFIALTAGVVEEFIFRGYLQPRMEVLLKSPVAAIMVSSAVFGVLHIGYGTFLNVAGPFLIGLVFAVYYSKFRNLKVLICCHFLWDFIIMCTQAGR